MAYTLITGACGGLGSAFVHLLAERNQPLFLTGRSEARLRALKAQLSEAFPDLAVCIGVCDLSDGDSRRELIERFDREGVTFSRLVYVAGADIQKPFEKYTQEKIAFQARVNFEGAACMAQAVFLRREEGTMPEILAVGSVSGIYPMPYFALYSAAKKALEQLFSALHAEWKGRAKVTCVLPGAIPTREDVIANIGTQGLWGRLAAKSPEYVAYRALKAVKRNRKRVIIGGFNRLMRVCTSLIPEDLKMKYIAKRWSKTEKDAF